MHVPRGRGYPSLMTGPTVILMFSVIVLFGIGLAVAATLERRRERRVIEKDPQRARRRWPRRR